MHLVINQRTVVPILASLALLIACIARVAIDGAWETYLLEVVLSVFGALTFLFTDTVVELLEDDKPHAEWFQTPNTWVKVGGGALQVYCALVIFGVLQSGTIPF